MLMSSLTDPSCEELVRHNRAPRRRSQAGLTRASSAPYYSATRLVKPEDLPLVGVTILDLTRVLAGPYCTRLLCDLGARVIKIERQGEGDEMRRNYLQLEPGRGDQSSYFTRVNAGKESVGVDLSRAEGQAIVHDLAKVSDVVVENFMPGVVARLHCDYATLRALKPDLIYCSISGFGQTGPWRARPAFAHIINAVSGLMHLEQGDEPAPRTSTLDAADSVTYAAVLNGGQEFGNPRPGMIVAPIGDRYLAMQFTGSGELWPRLLSVMGRPELGRDPRFDTAEKRRTNWRELRPIVESWLGTFASVEDARKTLSEARIPCAPVLRPAEVIAEPHMAERQFFPAVPHPGRGAVRVTASPYHIDGEPVHPRGPAAYRVGEHTRAVLGDLLGYPPARIAELARNGVIQAP